MVVDFDWRILAQADPGPGTKIVVAPIDISALRHERELRTGHHMLAHLRTEAYPVYRERQYPPGLWTEDDDLTFDKNTALINEAKGNENALDPENGV